MNTDLIDAAIEAAKTNPVLSRDVPVSGWPSGSTALITVVSYKTVGGTGFQIIGTIAFPNGYKAVRIVDLGPNASKATKAWPKDIESEAVAYGSKRAAMALEYIGKSYSQAEQTALLFKWGGIVAAGTQTSHPMLAAVESWIAAVSTAALTGTEFPKPPGTSFVALMAE